jgi:hypothetical protein
MIKNICKVLLLTGLFAIIGCMSVPADWTQTPDESNYRQAVMSGTDKDSNVATVYGMYKKNTDTRDMEMKFEAAFSRLFMRYKAQVSPSKNNNGNIEAMGWALYGRYEVEALFIIKPDGTYVLKVASSRSRNNDRWARILKNMIDNRK